MMRRHVAGGAADGHADDGRADHEEQPRSDETISHKGAEAAEKNGDHTSPEPQTQKEGQHIPGQGSSSGRLLSLELFRGIVFIVSACHFTEYWSKSTTGFKSIFDLVVFFDFIGRLFTAIMVFSFGLNLHFWRESRKRRGRSNASMVWTSIKRGIIFFLLSIMFNFLVWEVPANLFDMDILMFYAFAALLMPLFWHLRPRNMLVLVFLIFIGQTALRQYADVSSAWVESTSGEKERLETLSNENSECIEEHCSLEQRECFQEPDCYEVMMCMYRCKHSEPNCIADCVDPALHGEAMPVEWDDFYICVLDEQCMSRAHFERRYWWSPFYFWVRAVTFEGHFAIMPFIAYALLGFACGPLLFTDTSVEGSRRRSRILGWLTLVFLSVAIAVLVYLKKYTTDARRDMAWTEVFDDDFALYPMTTEPYIVWSFGSLFFFLWLFEPLNRVGSSLTGFSKAFVELFVFFNRYLLSFYIGQHCFILWPIRLWAACSNVRDQWWYFETKPVPPLVSVLMAYVYIGLMYLVMRPWESRFGSVFTAEWIVRAFSGA